MQIPSRKRPQPKTPRRATLAGAPIEVPAPPVEEKPKRAPRKRASKESKDE